VNEVIVRHPGARALEQRNGLLKIQARADAIEKLQGGFMHPAALFLRQARKAKTLLTSNLGLRIRHGTLL
jgi:hypothetical protein